jgi:hypothetical protein
MVNWQIEAGQLASALEYAERGRARALVDQLAAGHIDVLASIPADIRGSLEAREVRAKARVIEFQQRLTRLRDRTDMTEDVYEFAVAELTDSLSIAYTDYETTYDEIRGAGHAWQELLPPKRQQFSASEIQRSIVPPDGLVLFYQVGEKATYLVPPPIDEPSVTPLQISDQAARILGIEPGPVTEATLKTMMFGPSSTNEPGALTYAKGGVMRGFELGDMQIQPSYSEMLHALRQILVPEEQWQGLRRCREVIIIPDGSLHWLPFEASVVAPSTAADSTVYWLDVGPVVRYAPSLTALHAVIGREEGAEHSLCPSDAVLSLSDPIFDPAELRLHAEDDGDSTGTGSEHDSFGSGTKPYALRNQYLAGGGSLIRLPGTARETAAIEEAFGGESTILDLVTLAGAEATEANLRNVLPGKRYVHLATHGLIDRQARSLFAALALTPPLETTADSEDDGFLQLYEIYDLEMTVCELAVLSACQTHIGQYVQGEGVFALSRGFLVAGASRVIASQWDVEDESTALLIGELFQQIGAARRSGKSIDYAAALRDAKRLVRGHRKWSDPFYWAPFVFIGAP